MWRARESSKSAIECHTVQNINEDYGALCTLYIVRMDIGREPEHED